MSLSNSQKLNSSSLSSLRSEEQLKLLDDIDELRHLGIERVLSLPQLVVCGDQSSGKSSILEAVSGVPFPRKDSLCTRFATELILRKSPQVSVDVEIVPCPNRDEHERKALLDFKYTLENFAQIPLLINEAKEAMGLRGFGSAFSRDILRIKISGPDHPHLTVVDLPGLIHSENKSQTAADIEVVTALVESYMKSPRSIILAVVSAQNDYANQVILTRARILDPQGLRTMGLITKPDTLPQGSESETSFMQLARNEDVTFALGWHVLRNRDYQTRDSSATQRDLEEERFFSQGAWEDLPRNMVGVSQLRLRLSKVLMNHIRTELPGLIAETENHLIDCQVKLAKLGPNRENAGERHLFLTQLSQSFTVLCKAACDGIYEDSYFGDALTKDGASRRIRAIVQNENIAFASQIREVGHFYQIEDVVEVSEVTEIDGMPRKVSRIEALGWARRLYTSSRGRELPGTFSPLLIGELFRHQSRPWEKIAQQHLQSTCSELKAFIERLLSDLTDETTRTAILTECVYQKIDGLLQNSNTHLANLFRDRSTHATTYNHYFTDIIQKKRQTRQSKALKKSLERHIKSSTCSSCGTHRRLPNDLSSLVSSLASEMEPDMDEFACNELLDGMLAYYKVAMKTFVDNVSVQVVEACLLKPLPELLTPMVISDMDAALVDKIALESVENQEARKDLMQKLSILEKSMKTCRHHVGHPATTLENLQNDADNTAPPLTAESRVPSPRVEAGQETQMVDPEPPAVPSPTQIRESVDNSTQNDDGWGLSWSGKRKGKKRKY